MHKKVLTFSLIYRKTILWIEKGNQAENWINPTLHYFMYTLKELQLHLIASFVLGWAESQENWLLAFKMKTTLDDWLYFTLENKGTQLNEIAVKWHDQFLSQLSLSTAADPRKRRDFNCQTETGDIFQDIAAETRREQNRMLQSTIASWCPSILVILWYVPHQNLRFPFLLLFS